MFDMFTNLMLDTITDLIVVLLLVARIGGLLRVKIAARSLLFGRSYGGCRRADFGSALFRVDAPQPPRDPGVQSLPREDGWERHHEDNRRERELAFGSSRLGPLYTALGSP